MVYNNGRRSVKVVSQGVSPTRLQVDHVGAVTVPVSVVEDVLVHVQAKHMIHHAGHIGQLPLVGT